MFIVFVRQKSLMERKKLNRNTLLFCLILIAILLTPLFLIPFTIEPISEPEFLVGVEYALSESSVEGCKALVDRVKNFTNFFVIDSLGIALDFNSLNEVADYVYDAGLYFIVFFISCHEEETVTMPDGEQKDVRILRYNYYPHIWISDAKKKYGDKFLGAYTMDEPGGNQLDSGPFQLIEDAKDETEAANLFVDLLYLHIEYFLHARECDDITVLTSEYGLYWYDYKVGYDTVLVEFAWNHSRPLNVALCRGAATAHNKDWGIMLTWTYNAPPYLVSGDEMFDDLITGYHNGAKYAVIFDHPATSYSDYGILTDEHFVALENFWNYLKNNPEKHATKQASAVYVLPEDFGFGLRRADDKIWGIWEAETDIRVKRIWNDLNLLVDKYGFGLDIIYNEPEIVADIINRYDEVFLWNEPIT
jgi:hypothetical protein